MSGARRAGGAARWAEPAADPDGHQFKLGRGEATLRDVAEHYGLTRDEIAVDPGWLERRKPRR